MSRVKMVDISHLGEEDYLIDVGNSPVFDYKLDKYIDDIKEPMVMYLGRMVKRQHFRVFVYGEGGKSKIAEGYTEFKRLIESGEWFESQELALQEKEEIQPEEVITPILGQAPVARKNYNRKKKEEQPDLPIMAAMENEVTNHGSDS